MQIKGCKVCKGCVGIRGTMRSFPTSGLEALPNLPLDSEVKRTAINKLKLVSSGADLSTHRFDHLNILKEISELRWPHTFSM